MQLRSDDAISEAPAVGDRERAGDRLRRALDGVPVPILVLDGRGRTVTANTALRDLLGVTGQDGASDRTIAGLEGRPGRFLARTPGWQRVWRIIEEGPTERPRLTAVEDARGDRRHVEVTVAAGPDDGEQTVTLHDVTPVRTLRQQVSTQVKVLSSARGQLRAARDEMRQAEAQFAELIAELEAATEASPGRRA